MLKFAAVFIFFIATAPMTRAYSISTHELITERALKEYALCEKALGLKPLPKDAEKKLVKANLHEDKSFVMKMTNWHFYNPEKPDLGTGTFSFGSGSFKTRYDLIVTSFNGSHRLLELGEITHYLQDVTNPAHVAPVYHLTSDTFDNYDFEDALPDLVSVEDCAQLAVEASQTDPEKLLDETAKATLKASQAQFKYMIGLYVRYISWRDAFWSPHYDPKSSKQQGFGHYGEFGNNFGEVQIDDVTVSPKTYQEFARQQVRAALNATIEMFMIYEAALH